MSSFATISTRPSLKPLSTAPPIPWYVFSNVNLYYGWVEDFLPDTGEYVHYYYSDFDQDNDGRLDGYRLHDCTMNIDGKNYTFDSNGICTNFDD